MERVSDFFREKIMINTVRIADMCKFPYSTAHQIIKITVTRNYNYNKKYLK